MNITNETLRQPLPSTEDSVLPPASSAEPEVVVLAKLLASRTRERDEISQREIQARKAFDTERQELRREISDLRRQSEEQPAYRRECAELKKQIATMTQAQAESERMLAEVRKEREQAGRGWEEKLATAEKGFQEKYKQLEAQRAAEIRSWEEKMAAAEKGFQEKYKQMEADRAGDARSLTERLTEHQLLLAERDAHHAVRQRLMADLQAQVAERQRLRNELDETCNQTERSQAALEHERSKLVELQNQNSSLAASLEELKHRHAPATMHEIQLPTDALDASPSPTQDRKSVV